MAAVGGRGRGGVAVRPGIRESEEGEAPEDGRVENGLLLSVKPVVRKWLVYEDGVVANQIQEQEIQEHYNKNRFNRRTVRDDIPVARKVYTYEETKAQQERMQRMEEQRKIAAQDAEVAKHLHRELTQKERDDLRKRQLHDEAVARHLSQSAAAAAPQKSARAVMLPADSKAVAKQLQERENIAGVPWKDNSRREQTSLPVQSDRLEQEKYPTHAAPCNLVSREQEKYPAHSTSQTSLTHESTSPPGSISKQSHPNRSHTRLPTTPSEIQSVSNNYHELEISSEPTHDEVLARRFQLEDEFDEEAIEEEDRQLAIQLQKKEEERYERKQQQRQLAKDRRRLEDEINRRHAEQPDMSLERQEEVEDDGDFSDFYIPPDPSMSWDESRRLQEEQDAEIARLIQDQERKRTHNDMLKEKQSQIAAQDAELARILQEEEKLKSKRRELKYKQRQLKQQREVVELNSTYNQNRSVQASVHPRNSSRGNQDWQDGGRSPAYNRQSSDERVPRNGHEFQSATAQSNTSSGSTNTNQSRHDHGAARAQYGHLSIDDESSERRMAVLSKRGTAAPSSTRRDMYAEQRETRVVQTAANQSQNRRPIDVEHVEDSSPGPALPERRYTIEDVEALSPPYRDRLPPPYRLPATQLLTVDSSQSAQSGPVSPMSEASHYDAPWDMSRLEHQLMREAMPGQAIRPQHVMPPHQTSHQIPRESPSHSRSSEYQRNYPKDLYNRSPDRESRSSYQSSPDQSTQRSQDRQDRVQSHFKQFSPSASPPVEGAGGRPLIEHTENGQIVMNIAEMIDPTYQRRQQQRHSYAEDSRPVRPNSQVLSDESNPDFAAVAGQRRSGKRNSQANRNSCKQQ